MFVHATHSIDIRWLTRISQIQDIVVGNKTLAEINSKPPAAADIVQMLLAEEEMEGGGDSYAPSTSGFGMSSAGFMGGTSALFAADEGDDFFGQSRTSLPWFHREGAGEAAAAVGGRAEVVVVAQRLTVSSLHGVGDQERRRRMKTLDQLIDDLRLYVFHFCCNLFLVASPLSCCRQLYSFEQNEQAVQNFNRASAQPHGVRLS
jgi:hypothetical protein